MQTQANKRGAADCCQLLTESQSFQQPLTTTVSWLRFWAGTVQQGCWLGVDVKLDSEIVGERSLWLLSQLIFQTANSKS